MRTICTQHAIFNSICEECVTANFNKKFKRTKYERDNYREANRLNAQTVKMLAERSTEERVTLLVFANQYLALQRWIEHTVPEWTTEVECCMHDCQATAKRIIDYLDGKVEHLNPRKEKKP